MKVKKPPWQSEYTGFSRARLSDARVDISWGEFDEMSGKIATVIAAKFEEQSRIGLWGANSLEYLIVLFGIIRAGHTAVPLNTRMTEHELSALSHHVELNGMLTERGLPFDFPGLPSFTFTEIGNAKVQPVETVPRAALGEHDTAVLICSSGSDGSQKAVPHSMKSLLAHAHAVNAHLSVTARDKWLLCLPLFHVGGLTILFRCLTAGASMVISKSANARELNARIDHDGVSLISVVPTTLQQMLKQRVGKPFPETLRGIIVGGGPITQDLLEECPAALPTYGLTEAGSMLTCARPACSEHERMTAGSMLPGTEIRIVDEEGNNLRWGEVGEIIARGAGVANGYWRAPIKTAHTFREGWLHTGDVGLIDQEGFLNVLARRTDVIVSGGENIYPAEIVRLLRQHPEIETAVVLPVEDVEWGQAPGALIVRQHGAEISQAEVIAFLESRLARYKLPKRIIFADELPLLPNGKVNLLEVKRRMREEE